MNEPFDALCELLAQELERQETILALCHAQGDAARTHDIEQLQARTATLTPLIQEAAQAENTRNRLLKDLAQTFGLASTRPTLSPLAAMAPEPWASRIRFYQTRLANVLKETRALVRINAVILRTSLKVVAHAMKALDQCNVGGELFHAYNEGPGSAGYDAGGFEPRQVRQPAIIDQRG